VLFLGRAKIIPQPRYNAPYWERATFTFWMINDVAAILRQSILLSLAKQELIELVELQLHAKSEAELELEPEPEPLPVLESDSVNAVTPTSTPTGDDKSDKEDKEDKEDKVGSLKGASLDESKVNTLECTSAEEDHNDGNSGNKKIKEKNKPNEVDELDDNFEVRRQSIADKSVEAHKLLIGLLKSIFDLGVSGGHCLDCYPDSSAVRVIDQYTPIYRLFGNKNNQNIGFCGLMSSLLHIYELIKYG